MRATAGKWIDVEDRVPEDDDEVLVAYRYAGARFVTIAEYGEGVWSSEIPGINFKDPARVISHWMPKPLHPDDLRRKP